MGRDEQDRARVVRVVTRRSPWLRGQVIEHAGELWVSPLQQRLPDGWIDEKPAQFVLRPGDWVQAEMVSFPRDAHEAPAFAVRRRLEASCLLREQISGIAELAGCPIGAHAEAFAEAERLPPATGHARAQAAMGQAERALRLDVTDLPFVTIDGEDARDFDDAVCLEQRDDGTQRLWVAIADVAHHVAADTALDAEALRRGVSVYFPRGVEPMLPLRLSADRCSLRPLEERLVLVCRMDFEQPARGEPARKQSGRGEPVRGKSARRPPPRSRSEDGQAGPAEGGRVLLSQGRPFFARAVLRSQARLTYRQVQRLFDGHEVEGLSASLAEMLQRLRGLAEVLRARHVGRGACQFAFAEQEFVFDAAQPGAAEAALPGMASSAYTLGDEVWPADVLPRRPTEATQLIETLMIAANEAAAAYAQAHALPVLYRVHDAPSARSMQALRQGLSPFGVHLAEADWRQATWVNRLLRQIEGHTAAEQLALLVLKSMAQAVYDSACRDHFGLASAAYLHFTSPIRRYPDLWVQRVFSAHLLGETLPEPPLPLKTLAALLSTHERRADAVEKQVRRLYSVLAVTPWEGERRRGRITSIDAAGVEVTLESPFVRGWLSEAELFAGGWRWERSTQRFVRRAGGRGGGGSRDIGLDGQRRGSARPLRSSGDVAQSEVFEGKRRREARVLALGERLWVRVLRAVQVSQSIELGCVREG